MNEIEKSGPAGDVARLVMNYVTAFQASSASSLSRFTLLATNLSTSPVSPYVYGQNLSPHSTSGYYSFTNGARGRPGTEYSSSTGGEAPSTNHSASTPATLTSVVDRRLDRKSIDWTTNPQPAQGAYICSFNGCSAPPFPTLYFLNSHADVNASARRLSNHTRMVYLNHILLIYCP
jgi:hypothetical protein